MTATEQVKSCIEKAVQGGWHKDKIKGRKYKIHKDDLDKHWIYVERRQHTFMQHEEVEIYLGSFNDIIFNKSFLKAFFGEGMVCNGCGNPEGHPMENIHIACRNYTYTEAWKYHGNQLLLSDDRVKYMANFLEV